jgi:ThiF family
MTREEFEREFNSRTLAYHPEYRADDRPVVVVFGESADSAPGHLLLTSLANQLARAHRRLVFVGDLDRALKCTDVFGLETLEAATVGLARTINPFIEATAERERPAGEALITVGVGADAELTLGCDRWLAHIGTSATVESSATSMLGAALASIIGSAATFHRAIGQGTLPHGAYSAWEYGARDGAQGPALLQPVDVGRVLQVGGGAVGCALDYWLAFLGVAGAWTIVDGDHVEVNNLNRQLLFLAADAGFPAGSARKKSEASAERLGSGWRSLPHWYDAQGAEEARTGVFDLVLPLANERGLRPLLQGRAQTVLLHATTTPNWTALAHRHVAGHDDCLVCRLPAEDEPVFTCSTGTVGEEVRVDASLPFLSAAGGLLLLADIVRLHLGCLVERPANFGSLDLRTSEPVVRQLRWECRDACPMWLPAAARLRIAEGHRFASLDAAFAARAA